MKAITDPGDSSVRPPQVSLHGVSARYGSTPALSRVSLDVARGEILCLLGPSGSGKSTLLRVVAGIERPSEGRVRIEGADVAAPGQFIEPEQRRVGMVFQDFALFPHLTVADNIAFGLRGLRRHQVEGRVSELLAHVGLQRFGSSYPHTLSGGERQRVALARALAPRPRVLLMDEPFSSLDVRLRDDVRRQTVDVLRATGTTTILVTHDPGEAMRIADRIALLENGRLVECGPPEEIYARPSTLFGARFFSDVNEVCGTCRNGVVDTPLGCFAAPHLPEQAAARVCIRPQHLRLASQHAGIPARVVSTLFLGEVEHLSVAVRDLDAPLTLCAFGRTKLKPEDTVYLEIRPEDVLIVPQADRPPATSHPHIGAA